MHQALKIIIAFVICAVIIAIRLIIMRKAEQFTEEPHIKTIPIAPGETITDILVGRGLSFELFCHRMGMTEEEAHGLLVGGVVIDENIAKKLQYILGPEERFWLNLQKQYDKDMKAYKKELEAVEKYETNR